jgi:phosphoglycerate dehydrogenase-like enzyme
MRFLEPARERARNNNYSDVGMISSEVKGKHFGIIGLGRIGQRVAELALAFGAKVSYWSKNRRLDFEERGCNYQDLDKLISTSDIISINIAQTIETEKLFSAGRLSSLKAGAVVINTSPNEIVDFEPLCSRLQKGDITYIFDHSDEMNESSLKALSKFANCITYPPIAYLSAEAQRAKEDMFIGNMAAFLDGKPANVISDLQML